MTESRTFRPEGGNEVSNLIETVRLAAESPSFANLDANRLLEIQDSVGRLMEIAGLRTAYEKQSKALIERIAAWEKGHASIIAGQEDYAQSNLSRMQEAVAARNMAAEKLENALQTLETSLNVRRQMDNKLEALIEQSDDGSSTDPNVGEQGNTDLASVARLPTSSHVPTGAVSDADSAGRGPSLSESKKEEKTLEVSPQHRPDRAGAEVGGQGMGVDSVEPSIEAFPLSNRGNAAGPTADEVAADDDAALSANMPETPATFGITVGRWR